MAFEDLIRNLSEEEKVYARLCSLEQITIEFVESEVTNMLLEISSKDFRALTNSGVNGDWWFNRFDNSFFVQQAHFTIEDTIISTNIKRFKDIKRLEESGLYFNTQEFLALFSEEIQVILKISDFKNVRVIVK